jgi:HlyD family secretion protein
MTHLVAARPRATTTIVIRKWHVAALSLAILCVAAFVHDRFRKKVEVRVASPTYGDVERTVSTSGMVTPVNDYPARANFSGMVEKVYVQLGEQVHPGQLLVLMKDQYALSRVINARAELESAEVNNLNVEMNGSQEDRIGFAADMLRAQNEQASAANALSTMQQLEKRGSVSEAEVTAAHQRLQTANAALDALKAKTTQRYSPTDVASWKDKVQADRAALAAENISYANSRITSPIAGTVYTLPVMQYDFVPMGADLLHVADLKRTHIFADFDEADIGRLHVGQPVTITWDGRPGQSWSGRVVGVPLAVTHSGSLNVGRATINIDSPGRDLPIGTNAAVIVTVDRHSHVLTIPREALRTDGSEHFTYRVSGGVLIRTPVDVGIVNALQGEITRGLQPGDLVALHATEGQALTNHLQVTTVK